MNEHYKKLGLDPIGAFKEGLISEDEYIGFCKGNIIKYVCRFQDKGGIEDLLKAEDYLSMLKEVIE